jgi:hypothetical protein
MIAGREGTISPECCTVSTNAAEHRRLNVAIKSVIRFVGRSRGRGPGQKTFSRTPFDITAPTCPYNRLPPPGCDLQGAHHAARIDHDSGKL